MNFQEQHLLSHLLPYDPSVKVGPRLKDGLKEYLLLLASTELAIQSLQQGELAKFDPLVGENACQIRAVKLALIIKKFSFDTGRLLEKIAELKIKVEELLNHGRFEEQISLRDVLEGEGLNFEIDYSILFLIKSYSLSVVKVPRPFKSELPLVKNESTDSKKLKEISSVGSMFADNLVTNLREKLSASSVVFIQGLVKDWCSMDPCVEMVSDKFSVYHRGLKCIPCYWTTRVLMKEALNHSIPVVMIAEQKAKDRNYETVRKTSIFFQPTSYGYKQVDQSLFDPNEPAVILLGATCRNDEELPDNQDWIEELLEYSPDDLILAYAASHRQYPDSAKDALVKEIQDTEYNDYKSKANEWGCSSENPSRFFLSHAFCDRIGNIQSHM